ncbi:hypothetical protein EDB84DRAFT_1656315 [Lactarius hengduanensis]|nr:hypothetical protein EDB84DRAFT_1656315 [Lactarius hengduanensis]
MALLSTLYLTVWSFPHRPIRLWGEVCVVAQSVRPNVGYDLDLFSRAISVLVKDEVHVYRLCTALRIDTTRPFPFIEVDWDVISLRHGSVSGDAAGFDRYLRREWNIGMSLFDEKDSRCVTIDREVCPLLDERALRRVALTNHLRDIWGIVDKISTPRLEDAVFVWCDTVTSMWTMAQCGTWMGQSENKNVRLGDRFRNITKDRRPGRRKGTLHTGLSSAVMLIARELETHAQWRTRELEKPRENLQGRHCDQAGVFGKE